MADRETPTDLRRIESLLAIMARLRDPDGGCPWDVEQTFDTIAPYTLEEAYEVADAIRRKDMAALREELGDLLLQVVYHARMAEEEGSFDFADVVESISSKMIARHPHVFGDAEVSSAADQTRAWEDIKAVERQRKGDEAQGILGNVPVALPALVRAVKLQKRAARVGFDWTERTDVLAKLKEEIAELEEAMASGQDEAAREELGDVLFVIANLARHLDADPEDTLARANAKFERRFRRVEALLAAQGRSTGQATLDEMEALWQQAKREERSRD
jgi:MazG family protein